MNLTTIVDTDDKTSELLKGSLLLEAEKNAHKSTKLRLQYAEAKNEVLRIFVAQACDEMEGIFRSTKAFASVEIAIHYTVWASYLKHNYGRDDAGCIYDAQDWIDKQ